MTHQVDKIEKALGDVKPEHASEVFGGPKHSVVDSQKHAIAARLIHNLTLEQLENLEITAKNNCKATGQAYVHFTS